MLKKLQIIIFSSAIAFTLCLSCKKGDDETTKPYMVGEVQFDLPVYVPLDSPLRLEAYGITQPTDIEYKWVGGSMFADTVVSRVLETRTPDTLGTFYLQAMAYNPDYYVAYTSKKFTTVDTLREGSLTGLPIPDDIFTDPRDGREYDVVEIGSLEWFAQNLAWAGAGAAFFNSPITESLFGRFYSWNEATGGTGGEGLAGGPQGVCPEGWHIPTEADWNDLAEAVSGVEYSFADRWDGVGSELSAELQFNGEDIWPWSYINLHKNTFGWNAIPTGCYTVDQDEFLKSGSYAFYWSAKAEGDRAFYRYIFKDEDTMPQAYTLKSGWGASVRCVRIPPVSE